MQKSQKVTILSPKTQNPQKFFHPIPQNPQNVAGDIAPIFVAYETLM